MKIYFATSNSGKFSEAKKLFSESAPEFKLEQLDTELTEIQTDDVAQLALVSVREAYARVRQPVFVEDAGLFINALKGFPGVYSKHALLTIGCAGILKLLENVRDRFAYFQAVIAYKDENGKEKVFKGICKGNIAMQARGREGFGFDPIFVPEGLNRTFAEDVETKTSLSHRTQAAKQLIDYLKQ